MELAMTKDEIISSWKNAISSKKQVGILAELNACPKSEIVRILYEGGVLSGQAVYQYRKSGLLPPAAEADMTEEFDRKVAAAGVPGEDKKNRCAECLFFERGDIDMDGIRHGTCYNDCVLDVLAGSLACDGFIAQRKEICACFEDCDGTDGGKSDPACRSFTERKKTEGEKTVIRATTEKEADIEGMPKTVSAENRAALPKMPEVVREMIAEKYAELKRSINVIEKQIDELTEDRNACLSDLEELDAFTERWKTNDV